MDLIATKPLPDPAFAQRLEQSESVRRLSGGKNRAAPRPNAAQNITYQNCYYTLVSTFDRNSPVAELHTWYSDLTGRVWYGKTNKADSHISVGIRADDTVSGFYASGFRLRCQQLHKHSRNIVDEDRPIWLGPAILVPLCALPKRLECQLAPSAMLGSEPRRKCALRDRSTRPMEWHSAGRDVE